MKELILCSMSDGEPLPDIKKEQVTCSSLYFSKNPVAGVSKMYLESAKAVDKKIS